MKNNSSANTTLNGPWLNLLRALWLILAVSIIGLWIVGTTALIREPYPDCIAILCDNVDIAAKDVDAAIDAGIPRDLAETMAQIVGSLSILTGVFYFVIAGVIFWRMSDDWLGMLVSITLVFLGGLGFTNSNDALLRAFPELTEIHDLISSFGFFSILVLFLLFPNGRFVPRWFGWAGALIGVLFLLNRAISSVGLGRDTLDIILFLSLILIAASSQIYRYFRVSTPIDRQQTKWVVLGLFGSLLLMITWTSVGVFYPPDEPGSSRLVALLIVIPFVSLLVVLFPLTFAISILRYRLWDIDIIINRGLIYGTLTILLALIYFGSITILQNLFTVLTGQQSPIALVVSTLVIAALFQPLYRRVQELINRRFYRGKYDAGKILTEFASTARDEVDLDKLTTAFISAVEESLQPATISLWLKHPSPPSLGGMEREETE